MHQEKKKKIRNEMEVINDTTGIQWILRDYYVWLYNNLLENLEEISQFLEMHNLQRLKHKEIENQSRSIMTNEVESVI